jgi:hypothetical protein
VYIIELFDLTANKLKSFTFLLLMEGSLKGRKFMLFLSNLSPVGFQKLAVPLNLGAVLEVTLGLAILWQQRS